jgi:hypothetical protein
MGAVMVGMVHTSLSGCTLSNCGMGVFYDWPATELQAEKEKEKEMKENLKKMMEQVGGGCAAYTEF